MEPGELAEISEDRAYSAASKLLIYVSKQISKLHPRFTTAPQQQDLTEYFDKNWDKIISASCQKNKISPDELISAIIDLL